VGETTGKRDPEEGGARKGGREEGKEEAGAFDLLSRSCIAAGT